MCENSRQRVIHISIAAALIFLALQVACAANGGYLEADGGVGPLLIHIGHSTSMDLTSRGA